MITDKDIAESEVSKSTLEVDTLVSSFHGDPELEQALQSATVLIVPTDLSPEYKSAAFPESTRDVFCYMRGKLGNRGSVEAATKDEDYVEFAYHSEQVILPILYVAEAVLLPIVFSILGSYLYDRLKGRQRTNEGKVKSEVHFKNRDGTQLKFKYDGPASTYERVALRYLRELEIHSEEDE